MFALFALFIWLASQQHATVQRGSKEGQRKWCSVA